jgi:carbonic anhydrase
MSTPTSTIATVTKQNRSRLLSSVAAKSGVVPLLNRYRNLKVSQGKENKTMGVASTYFDDLVVNGQHPSVMCIACSDSRVDPAIVTGSKPGELFMVRNVAALVPKFEQAADAQHHGTSAALQYGVTALEVSDLVVFGHAHCGGIGALMSTDLKDKEHTNQDFIENWVSIGLPAKERVLAKYPNEGKQAQNHLCERESTLVSVENLMTFPWIKERVDDGRLTLHAWYFNLENASIEVYDPIKKVFRDVPLEEAEDVFN